MALFPIWRVIFDICQDSYSGLGIGFAASIPTIEQRSELFAALSFIVVVGGLARLCAVLVFGMPGTPHVLALGMELVVVPLLFVWQRRVALAFRS